MYRGGSQGWQWCSHSYNVTQRNLNAAVCRDAATVLQTMFGAILSGVETDPPRILGRNSFPPSCDPLVGVGFRDQASPAPSHWDGFRDGPASPVASENEPFPLHVSQSGSCHLGQGQEGRTPPNKANPGDGQSQEMA